jgi:hypothetical protein
MKVKTSELTDKALDWAVAHALGITAGRFYGLGGYFTDWSQGGPIIERERIEIRPGEQTEGWFGSIHNVWMFMPGPTPLVAAMRCFVASKLGDEVEIPDELAPLRPCRSPYCECTAGQCTHPGCYDARGEPT